MTLMSMFGYRFNKSIILTDKIDAKRGTKAISFLVWYINLWCTSLIALKFIKCEPPNNCLSKINCTFANIFAEKDEAVYKKLVVAAYHAVRHLLVRNSACLAFARCGKNQHQRRHKNSTTSPYF